MRSAVCGRVSRWRVRWVDGGGEEHSKSFQRKPDAQVPDPCRTVDARQGHGPVRNAHLGARLLRLTAVYGLGEAVALRRKHVGDRVLTVRSSPTAVTGKGIVESTTKTKRDRHVPVPEPVWRRLHAELPTDPNALVFPGRKGGFLPLGEYRWAFDNAGDQVGIEGWYRTVWGTPRPRWRSAQALTSRSCNGSLDTQQRR